MINRQDAKNAKRIGGIERRIILVGIFMVVLCAAALWVFKPWLPFTEPEIQQILKEMDSDANPIRFSQETENCRIAVASIPAGQMYVMVERQNGHWVYMDHAFVAGGLTPTIACPP